MLVVCPHCNTTNRVVSERLGDAPTCGKCTRSLFEGRPVSLTDENFDRHLSHSDDFPLVVDFWAPWCAPCKMMAPAYEQAAARIEPRARLAKVDTDHNPIVAQRYGIRSIPTMTIFKGGRPVASQSGALSLGQLMQWIESNL